MKRKTPFYHTPSKHLFVIRIVTGAIFLFFGILHLTHSENFHELLRAAGIPFVVFSSIFIRVLDLFIGVFLIFGFHTRLVAAVGCLSSGFMIWVCVRVMQLPHTMLPDGLKEKPFYPPIFLTIIAFVFSLYLIFFGAGRWSLDNRPKK